MGRIVEETAGRTYVYGDGPKYGLIQWRGPYRKGYDVFQFYRSGRTVKSKTKTKESALRKLKKFVIKV